MDMGNGMLVRGWAGALTKLVMIFRSNQKIVYCDIASRVCCFK
jgi:hypothetical protein